MTAPALGIDPGREGGACLLAGDGRTVYATWSWRPTGEGETAGYLLSGCVSGVDLVGAYHATLGRVGRAIAIDVPWSRADIAGLVLCVEGLFVHPRRAHGIVELAEYTGELLGALRELTDLEPLRPRASTWRPAILGIPAATPAAEAEAEAVRLVRAGLVRGLEELTDGHVAEAAAIARWGWVASREAAQLELLGGRHGA